MRAAPPAIRKLWISCATSLKRASQLSPPPGPAPPITVADAQIGKAVNNVANATDLRENLNAIQNSLGYVLQNWCHDNTPRHRSPHHFGLKIVILLTD